MRALLINEFKRGRNPEETLGLGNHKPYVKGDELICIEHIHWDGAWVITDLYPKFRKGQRCRILFAGTGQYDQCLIETVDNLQSGYFYPPDIPKFFKRI